MIGKMNNNIARIRKAKEMTQAELAARAHVTQSNVSKAENGTSSFEVKCKIATALGARVVEVFPVLEQYAVQCTECGVYDYGVTLSSYNDDYDTCVCWKCCLDITSDLQDVLRRRVGKKTKFYTAGDIMDVVTVAEKFGFDYQYVKDYHRIKPKRTNTIKNRRDEELTEEQMSARKQEELAAFMVGAQKRASEFAKSRGMEPDKSED